MDGIHNCARDVEISEISQTLEVPWRLLSRGKRL